MLAEQDQIDAPNLKFTWIDRGVEPKCAPDPAFPDGKDLDACVLAPDSNTESCFTRLPYPAKRCGYYGLICSLCNQSVLITTAGRLDDPRSIRLPCNLRNKRNDENGN